MSKNGILVCAGEYSLKNIGDYVQSVAQEQFYDRVDCYVERENLHKIQDDERINVIMNAWFMHHPENFPPSSAIRPLFVSFHIVPSISERLLSPEVVSYLKTYEPIGARDTNTKKILERHGIKSYFSGCLTLTLGLKYKSEVHDNTVCFVDPYYELGGRAGLGRYRKYISAFIALLRNYSSVKKMNTRFKAEFRSKIYRLSPSLDKLLHCASFFDAYRKCFDEDMIINAEYILHTVDNTKFHGNDDKMVYARQLLRTYAKARLVVTSRIHCGLPCLGIETPVIFVSSDKLEGSDAVRSSGRFGGLINLFYTMRFTDKGMIFSDKDFQDRICGGKVTGNTRFTNKDDYKPIQESLIQRVKEFLESDNKHINT